MTKLRVVADPQDTEKAVTVFLDQLTGQACRTDPNFIDTRKRWRKLVRGMPRKFGADGREIARAITDAFEDGAHSGARAVARRWIVTNKMSALKYALSGRVEPQEGTVAPVLTKAGL